MAIQRMLARRAVSKFSLFISQSSWNYLFSIPIFLLTELQSLKKSQLSTTYPMSLNLDASPFDRAVCREVPQGSRDSIP